MGRTNGSTADDGNLSLLWGCHGEGYGYKRQKETVQKKD